MYGFQAISKANGWIITLTGVGIVFMGLLILAVFIANFERILRLWDYRGGLLKRGKGIPEDERRPSPAVSLEKPRDVVSNNAAIRLTPKENEVLRYFHLITDRLGDPFSLQRLLEQAEKRGIGRPYHHLDHFLKLKVIVECEGTSRGFYKWRDNLQIITSEEGEDSRREES